MTEIISDKFKPNSEQIINSLPGVYYLISQDNKFVGWNQNFLDVTGYNDIEFSSLSPLDLFDESDKLKVSEKIQEVFRGNDTTVEAQILTKKI